VDDRCAQLKVLVTPVAYNEAQKIVRVLDRCRDVRGVDILVVDDGSDDGTPDAVEARGFACLRQPVRRGVGAAIRTAIQFADGRGYDVLIVLAGNDKDRPDEIPRLLAPIREQGFDFVQGSRYLPGGSHGNMPLYRRIATQWLHPWLFSFVSGRFTTDSTNGFRAFRLSLTRDPRIRLDQPWLDRYELEPYLYYKAIRLGYRVMEVPVTKIYPPRELGYTKMQPFVDWWRILRPLIFLHLRIKT
jgi:dolichol-phosphate mannosyltransferase